MKAVCVVAVIAIVQAVSLFGSWIGPIDIFTTQSALNPSVGINVAGNAVILATASDDGTNYYEKGAQLVAGVVLNLHDYPAIDPLFIGPGGEFTPTVAVNAAGNAIGLWAEYDGTTTNDFIRAVVFENNIWGTPTILSNPSSDSVLPYWGLGAIIDNENKAIVAWNGNDNLETSQYASSNWSSVVEVPTLSDTLNNLALVGSPSAQAMLGWSSVLPAVYVSYYDGSSWSSLLISTDVYSSCNELLGIAMNVNNDGIFIWQNEARSLVSTRLTSGVPGSISSFYTPVVEESIYSLAVAIDNLGNAIAVWTTQIGATTYKVITSRYSAGSWGPLTILDTADFGYYFTNPNIAIDGQGNAYAVWEKDYGDQQGKIYYNQYTSESDSWLNIPTLLSSPDVFTSNNPRLSMNQYGGAVVVWSIDPPISQSIQAVYMPNQNITPPVNLVGKQIKKQFLTQTDLINRLTWSASTAAAVVSYKVHRNGTLIGIVPSTGPLVYEDHNRKKGGRYTYSISSVNAIGAESGVVTVVIP